MYRFLVFLLFCSLLCAEDSEGPSYMPTLSSNDSFPMVNIEGEPNAIIAGCVNVITGDYFDLQRDLVIVGGEPLVLERSYSSSDTTGSSLCNGWHFNIQGCLFADHRGQNYVLKSSFGTELEFDNQSNKLHCSMHRKGFVNNASGIISGKTNLKNYSLTHDTSLTRVYKLDKGDGSSFQTQTKKRQI